MARTKDEIAEEIKEAFVSNQVLQDVYGIDGNSSFDDEFSKVSLEAAIIEVIASSGKTIEDLLEAHMSDVLERIDEMTPGTLKWYSNEALKFQIGDVLEWNPTRLVYEYDEIDEDKRIIELCAVTEESGILLIRVAKLNANGDPTPLDDTSPDELGAFKSYMEQIKYAGVFLNIVSRPPDVLHLDLRIYYNPMIINPNGSLASDSSIYPVDDAVRDYLKLMPFNGRFNVTDLIDALQDVEGVVNPIFKSAFAQTDTPPQVEVEDYYSPDAGYMVLGNINVEYIAAE